MPSRHGGGRRGEMTRRTASSVHRERLKILLVGHSCSPDLGSEPGFAWNWARELSAHHDVWVVARPLYRANVEAVTCRLGARAPRMVWVDLPTWFNPSRDPAYGQQGIHLHDAAHPVYLVWQRAALKEARRLHAVHKFDIVHHVSWGTVNAPPGLWRLGVPFVWGPIGGGQAAPLSFARYLGWRGVLRETARALRRRLMPFLPSLRRAAANSAIILATNRETVDVLRRAGATRIDLFLDGGVRSDDFVARQRVRRSGEGLELLWAGRLEPRKGLSLALEAMARVADLPVRLSVAGNGSHRETYERQAARLGLAGSVRFLGLLPRSDLRTLFAASDAFLFTSLRDSFGSVVIEAMAAGLPILGLDHQGVGTMISDQSAIKVPVLSPMMTIDGLERAIRALAASPELGSRMSEAARRQAATETWRRRVARMDEIYRHCLSPPRRSVLADGRYAEGFVLREAS
jgi:glycosyltransferase involved in cell wall biosynthesis